MRRPDDDGSGALDGIPSSHFPLALLSLRRERTNRGRRTVLVVEPASENLLDLTEILSDAGYHIVLFSSAFEALESVCRIRPAVVVADSHLPGLGGLALLASLKRASPRTRVILTSDHMDRPVYSDVLQAGGETLIHKPCEPGVLLNAVKRASTGVRGHPG